jgi:hypothetical protein
MEEVICGYNKILKTDFSESEEIVPKELKIKEIDLRPGVKIRKKGLHQKGIKIYSQKPSIDYTKPLVLAVISQNRWVTDPNYLQDYAVVVKIKHSTRINLYQKIKEKIEERVKIRMR